jgi:hypothetical protein
VTPGWGLTGIARNSTVPQEAAMLPRILLVLMAVALGLISLRGATAQSTPIAGQPGCSVEPRTPEEIAQIKATPVAATSPAASPEATEPVDPETLSELQRVVEMADACAEQGDFGRLAALYSEHAIQSGVLDHERVPITPGTPATTPGTSPQPGKYGPPTVSAAYRIDADHIVAEVERGPTIRELRFVRENGRWLIDSNEAVTGRIVEDHATPDQSAVLPMPVMQAIIDLLTKETGEQVQSITITDVQSVEWSDTFLGCPVEGSFAAQVITPGYRVQVEYKGTHYEVHTDLDGHAVTC